MAVTLVFIKPKDLPEIANFCGKVFYRARRLFKELGRQFKEMENELGIDELKQELNRGIAEEKAKIEDDTTVIVDMYGQEHKVPNLQEIRPDLTKEQIQEEVKNLNQSNSSSKNF